MRTKVARPNESEMVTELQKKMGGWIVELVAPALIMVMTGSLAFFLMEVSYFGSYQGRVGWVLGLFIFASVLTSRISIMEGFDKATFYGMLLGGATIFVLTTLSNMSLFMAMALIGVIWWFNSKLTWDCTVIDSSRDSTDRGLLNRFGFRSKNRTENDDDASSELDVEPDEEVQGTSSDQVKKSTSWTSRFIGKKRVPNTPGVWVLILSLAAFPIFGIGQGFIDEEARRQNAFFYFCTYLAAGLGLLVTTALIGLQRYLMRRNATMPNAVALSWVGVGTLMIFVILVGAWMLPRPYSEYSVAENPFKYERTSKWGSSRYSFGNEGKQESRDNAITNSDQQPYKQSNSGKGRQDKDSSGGETKSKSGKGKSDSDSSKSGSPGKEKGSAGKNQSPNSQKSESGKGQDRKNPSKSGNSPGGNKESSKQDSKGGKSSDQNDGKSQVDGGDRNPNSQKQDPSKSNNKKGENDQQGQKGSEKGDQKSNQDSSQSKSGRSNESDSKGAEDKSGSKGKDKSSQPAEQQKQEQRNNNSSSSRGGTSKTQKNANGKQDEKQNEKSNQSKQSNSQSRSQQNPSRSMQMPSLRGILWILQWVVAAVLAIVAIYFLWKYRQSLWQQLVAFVNGLKEFWANLWNRKNKQEAAESNSSFSSKRQERKKAFAEFANPFQTADVQNWSMADLVRYSFEALEAWGRERGCARGDDQTPHEFALKLAELDKNIGRGAKKLADFYCSIAFAKDRLEPNIVNNELVNLWSMLQGQQVKSSFQPA